MVKRKYIKPDVCFDSFELSSSIAAGCEMIASNQDAYACPVLIPSWGIAVFMENSGCDAYPPEGMDSICYHVPTADNNVFNS